ncbi:tRNA (adenosine(37)-N6)-dimethylallyltransferase MiaA [Paenibacillus sp. GCM10027626]|uniref:tRNA (adenosine(37)-N6)-dimethylallyltransferase MiaA n=1 Tax=Paenibacillus sp. GCM10027626 TaxID=3273411 RepID=UPI00362C6003
MSKQLEMPAKQKLLVLVGPTAVGKTSASIELAKAWNAEIISGDSMQVYRGMDVGTAKIRAEEMEGIPHHMIDICEPDHPFSVSEFQERCRALIAEIAGRGKLPMIVGGTGLYVESVVYGYDFSEADSDEAFRAEMQQLASTHGNEMLLERLRAVDPQSAARLHVNDQRRIIRALEIFHITGQTLSEQLKGQQKESPYHLCMIALTMERAKLYARIEQRVDAMMAEGLVQEVQGLLTRGVPPAAISMQGLGYKEIVGYLQGEYALEAAVELLKRDTRRFAKRQLSWFRHMKEIEWVEIFENFHENLKPIHAIIAGKFKEDIEYTSNQSF